MAVPAAHAPRPDALLGWMEGLADATRLRILRALEREELSVLELCEVLKLPQSTVSRHLKTLSGQGWLANRREGTASLYRLSPELDPGARRLWRLAREETEALPALRQDAARLESVLRDRRSDAERFFAAAASGWERLRGEVYGDELDLVVLRTLLPEAWTIADLGCGTGSLTLELARSGARVLGVDRSAAMLKVARGRLREQPRVELHQARLESLPIPDRACDVALLSLVLSYVEDVDPVLAEAHRILKPGGRLVALDAVAHRDEPFRRRLGQTRPGLDPAWLSARLESAGFERVATGGPIAARRRPSAPDLFLATGSRPARRGEPKE